MERTYNAGRTMPLDEARRPAVGFCFSRAPGLPRHCATNAVTALRTPSPRHERRRREARESDAADAAQTGTAARAVEGGSGTGTGASQKCAGTETGHGVSGGTDREVWFAR